MAFKNTILGKFLYKNKNIFLCIIIIILTWALISSNQKNSRLKNNISIINDTLSTYILKSGQIAMLAKTYQLTLSEMEDSLELLSGTIKDLEKALNNKIINAANINSVIKYDTIYINQIDSIEYINSDITWSWSFNNDWIALNGISTYPLMTTQINILNINVPITIGWTDNNIVWCISKNPYCTITDITAIERKKSTISNSFSHFNYGIQLGIGPTYTFGSGLGFGLYAGFGVGYMF